MDGMTNSYRKTPRVLTSNRIPHERRMAVKANRRAVRVALAQGTELPNVRRYGRAKWCNDLDVKWIRK
jgi:hypothetical protein